jgi:hypothetical protein
LACLGRGYIIGLVGVVMIDGTSRKADIAVLIPSTAL